MLGLVLIYFIGKKFYELSEEHNKSKWKFAILGVLTYYAGTFLAGLVYELLAMSFGFVSVEKMNNFKLALIALPFGIISCYLLYYFLEKSWKKEKNNSSNSIDDIGKNLQQ